jgi:hypothetical protein
MRGTERIITVGQALPCCARSALQLVDATTMATSVYCKDRKVRSEDD